MDCVICRLSRSSLLLLYSHQTLYWINHLFQNGRALLKCRIFIPPTTGNPDVEKSRSHAPVTTRTCPLWTDISRRCIFHPCSLCSGFVLPVLLLSSTPATVSPISPRIVPHFRVFIAKIRQVLTSLISPFALFRAFCVVVEFHSSHSFANFSVTCSSFS